MPSKYQFDTEYQGRFARVLQLIRIDPVLMFGLLMLTLAGLGILYSAGDQSAELMQKQVVRLSIAFLVMLVAAQVFGIAQDEEYDAETVARKLRDHALFIAFAPLEDPEIVVAIIEENGEHGSAVAPIAKAIMDKYLLEDDLKDELKNDAK